MQAFQVRIELEERFELSDGIVEEKDGRTWKVYFDELLVVEIGGEDRDVVVDSIVSGSDDTALKSLEREDNGDGDVGIKHPVGGAADGDGSNIGLV